MLFLKTWPPLKWKNLFTKLDLNTSSRQAGVNRFIRSTDNPCLLPNLQEEHAVLGLLIKPPEIEELKGCIYDNGT